MALSPQDKEFYREKMGWKSFGLLFLATVSIGAIAWPLLLYIQDWSAGDTSQWNSKVVTNLATMGFLLGMVVSTVMYLIFKLFLEMEWLPRRR